MTALARADSSAFSPRRIPARRLGNRTSSSQQDRSIGPSLPALNDFGRVEEPIAIVLPEDDVIGKVFGNTAAHRVDIFDSVGLEPARPIYYSLCHMPSRKHHGSFTRREPRQGYVFFKVWQLLMTNLESWGY